MRGYVHKPGVRETAAAERRAAEGGQPPRPWGEHFVHDFTRVALHGTGGDLPFRDRIQAGFGQHDLGDVRAHTGSRAAAAARSIGARAFTAGAQVAFDGRPDLHTAAHEAAHVIQQRAGVSEATDAHERHADAVADRIVRNEPAQELLDQVAPASGSRGTAMQRLVLQRKEKSKYGEFDTNKYNTLGAAGSEYGVEIELTFDPFNWTDAKKIGLTQSVRSALAGKAVAISPSMQKRMVPSGTGEGSQIDRTTAGAYANPLYATGVPGAKDKLGDTPTVASWGQHGWNYKDAAGKVQHQTAKLIDTPSLGGHSPNSEQVFETAALAVEGAQAGTYFGSVEWGWRIDGASKFTKLPLKLIGKDAPSKAFSAAVRQWNKWTTLGTIKTTPDPTNVYDAAYSVAFTVAKDTEVTMGSGTWIEKDVVYNDVTIAAGPDKGKTGRIKTNDMRDVGGGRATIPLP